MINPTPQIVLVWQILEVSWTSPPPKKKKIPRRKFWWLWKSHSISCCNATTWLLKTSYHFPYCQKPTTQCSIIINHVKMATAVIISIKIDPNRILLPHIHFQTKCWWHKLFLCKIKIQNVKSVAYNLLAHLDIIHISAIYGETCFIYNSSLSKISVLVWHLQINKHAKSNLLWNLVSGNWFLTEIWYKHHFDSLQVMQLNVDADRPSPFCCSLTCRSFSCSTCTVSTF